MNEFELIEHHFRQRALAREDVLLGIGDDAALLRVPAGAHLSSAQATLAGADAPELPAAFAHGLLARALARLACRAVTPRWATLSLTLASADPAWLTVFATHLGSALAAHGVALVGGDTTRGPRTATLCVHGHRPDLPMPTPPAPGDRLVLVDASEPSTLTRLPGLTDHRPGIACEGDLPSVVRALIGTIPLQVHWREEPTPSVAAGRVLIAVPEDEVASLPGARHIADLSAPRHA